MEEISRIVHQLLTVGERLAPPPQQLIIEQSSAVEPRLMAFVNDDALYPVEARGKGYIEGTK